MRASRASKHRRSHLNWKGGRRGQRAGHHLVSGLFDRPIIKRLESADNIVSSQYK